MHSQSRLIGTGRHGEIRAIRHEGDPRGWSVVKVIHAPVNGRSAATQPHDAVREARLLAKLSHPNIVPLLKNELLDKQLEHHLHLPLLPFSLHDLLDRREGLPEELLRSIMFQVLLALAHLHGQGIAHRDIKPANILFDWDGSVKLIDFGTAWTGGDSPTDGSGLGWRETKEEMCCSVGSGHYRAPELLFSPMTYNPFALDIWSLGVVVTDCLTPVVTASHEPGSEDSDDDDVDPLYQSRTKTDDTGARSPRTLFDDSFGELGLAASIFRILGTPTEDNWPEFSLLPDAGKFDFVPTQPRPLSDIYPEGSTQLLSLLAGVLRLSPGRRVKAEAALRNTWFDGTLAPSSVRAWYGLDTHVDLSSRYVEEGDGIRLVDLLALELQEAREQWG